MKMNPSITPRIKSRGINKGHTKPPPSIRGRRNEKTILEASLLIRPIKRDGFAARMYKKRNFRKFVVLIVFLILTFCGTLYASVPEVTQGCLQVVSKKGETISEFPLKHTDVQAEVSGMIVRVTVKQIFQNPYTKKIEAVYVFPLPNDSAVYDMLIKVGDRTIKGLLFFKSKRRIILC